MCEKGVKILINAIKNGDWNTFRANMDLMNGIPGYKLGGILDAVVSAGEMDIFLEIQRWVKYPYGYRQLKIAIEKGHGKMFEKLMQLNFHKVSMERILELALQEKQMHIVKILMNQYWDCVRWELDSVLIVSAESQPTDELVEVVSALLDKGGDPNKECVYGTAIQVGCRTAASTGDFRILRLFLRGAVIPKRADMCCRDLFLGPPPPEVLVERFANTPDVRENALPLLNEAISYNHTLFAAKLLPVVLEMEGNLLGVSGRDFLVRMYHTGMLQGIDARALEEITQEVEETDDEDTLPDVSISEHLPKDFKIQNLQDVCPIRLEGFEPGQKIIACLSCHVGMHEEDAERWILQKKTCPNCRRTLGYGRSTVSK